MDLSVSNEFLSLFIPESSEFTSDDLIQEFKIYVFRMMNITVDSLIQEQINNEYENNLLKKRFKVLFSERIKTILDISALHKAINEKINLIKSTTSNNLTLIEQNNISFNEKIINEQFGTITEDIRLNKEIINPSSGLLDLLGIPQRMIECFSHNNIPLYLEYRDFINSISSKDKVITLIKSKAILVNDLICALINKLIQVDYNFSISKGNIYDLLCMKRHPIFTNNDEINANEYIKDLCVLFFQIECYLKQSHSVNDQLTFFKEKIAQSLYEDKSRSNPTLSEIRKKFISKMMENYLIDIFKKIYTNNKISFTQVKETIESFLLHTQILNVISDENLIELDQMEKEFLFIHLNQMTLQGIEALKNYFLMTKDVRKLFSSIIDSIPLKYEIAIILYNNLYTIHGKITEETSWRLKDKITILDTIHSHCKEIIELIKAFFDENLFQFKLTSEIEKEFDVFKNIIFNKIILQFVSDVYTTLGLSKSFEIKGKKELVNLFNDEFSIQRLF